jgi:hypothetical protein
MLHEIVYDPIEINDRNIINLAVSYVGIFIYLQINTVRRNFVPATGSSTNETPKCGCEGRHKCAPLGGGGPPSAKNHTIDLYATNGFVDLGD